METSWWRIQSQKLETSSRSTENKAIIPAQTAQREENLVCKRILILLGNPLVDTMHCAYEMDIMENVLTFKVSLKSLNLFTITERNLQDSGQVHLYSF